MKFANRLAVAAVALVMCLTPLARAQVLDNIPDNAIIVLKVKNLKAVSDKVAVLAKAWGLDQMQPAFADPLGSLKGQSGMTKGLKEDGDMAFAMLSIPGTPFDGGAAAGADDGGGANEPLMVFLMPVSDYKAFLGNFQDVQTDGAVSAFKFANSNQESYTAQWGDYAAVANKKAALAKKPGGLKVQGLAGKELSGKDVVVFGNLALLRAKILPMVQQERQNWLAEIERNLQNDPQAKQFLPLVKTVAEQALDMAEGFLRDAEASTWGLSLGDKGVASTMVVEFTQGSKAAQQVGRFKNSNDVLVSGLPEGQYMVYGGYTQDPEAAAKLFDDVFGPASKQLGTLGEIGKVAKDYLDAARQQVANLQGQSFGLVTPENPMNGLFQGVGVARGNTKELAAAIKKQFKVQDELQQVMMKAMAPQQGGDPNAAAAAAPTKVEIKENAKTVEGVSFDVLTLQPNPDVRTPQAAQTAQMMRVMYGPQGLYMQTGAVDDKTLVTVMGGTDELLTKAIAAAKGNDQALVKGAQVQAVNGQLPPGRIGVMYVRLDNIVNTAIKAANQMRMQINAQMPADQPPIGVAFGTDGGAVRVDAYVPSELVQNVIATALQAFQGMQGGQPGGL